MKAINPYTGKVCGTYPKHTEKDVFQIIEKVDLAFHSWKKSDFSQRSSLMFRLGELLLEKKDWLSDLISSEMGKLKREAVAEVEKCAWVCKYYAENAEQFLASEAIQTEAKKAFVCYQPIGTRITSYNVCYTKLLRSCNIFNRARSVVLPVV